MRAICNENKHVMQNQDIARIMEKKLDPTAPIKSG